MIVILDEVWSVRIGWTGNIILKNSFFGVLDKFAHKDILNIVRNGKKIYYVSKTQCFVHIERSSKYFPALDDVHAMRDVV